MSLNFITSFLQYSKSYSIIKCNAEFEFCPKFHRTMLKKIIEESKQKLGF